MDRGVAKQADSGFRQSGLDQAPGILLYYRENKNQQVLLHQLEKTQAKAGGESPFGCKPFYNVC